MGESDDPDRAPETPLAAYEALREIAFDQYPSFVSDAVIERDPGDAPRNLRLLFVDDGFMDVWLSEDKYSYHWQSDGDVIRFDNAPHHPGVETHPHHRHVDGTIRSSPLVGAPVDDLPIVLDYLVQERL